MHETVPATGPAPTLAALRSSPTGKEATTLRDALIRSVEVDPLPIYLRVEDRNAMAHSVEARLPFLDHRLVALVFSMENDWKLRGALNKFVLREAMRDRIPESVRTRADKMGFPTSSSSWLAGVLYGRVKAVINEYCEPDDEYLRRAPLLERLERHRSGEPGHANVLFRSTQFLLWRAQTKVAPA